MIAIFAGIRALHLLSLMVIFGGAFFETALRRNVPGLAAPNRAPNLAAAFAALASALLWLGLATGQMSGDWTRAIDFSAIRTVLTATRFGNVLCLRLVLLFLMLPLCALRGGAKTRALVAGCALALISLTGHAAASGPPHFEFIAISNDAIHLLTAGFWIGGLVLLGVMLAQKTNRAFLMPILALFSRLGMIAVTLLLMTGIINALTILLPGPGRVAPVYLTLLGIKIALALGMIALAVFNRLSLMPRIADARNFGRLRASIAAEFA
ncbi:MAG TPA: CopD family protein, partial [Rhizomicrobium sp.]